MKSKIANVHYRVPVTFFKEQDIFVAYSPILDLSTSGKTFEEAQTRFQEAAGIFFEETIHHGTFDSVMANLGWTKIKQQWMPPVEVAHSSQMVRVPHMA